MNIPENAERKPLMIQGVNFTVPVVVFESDFNESLTPVCPPAMAAQILQQTFTENWRNNFAGTVNKALQAAAKAHDITFTKLSEVSDEDAQTLNDSLDTSALQAELDAYIQTYVPGVRRTGTGEALSPVDRETHKLSVEIVRDYLEREMGVGRTARSETYKAWDAKVQEELGMTGAEHIEEMAQSLIEANPSIRETAEANLAARAKLAGNVERPWRAA